MEYMNYWRLILATVLLGGGLWAACQSETPPTALVPRPASTVTTATAEPIKDAVIDDAVERFQAALADMRARGVPGDVIAERKAQADAVIEQVRNGTWHSILTPDERMALFEKATAGAVDRGLLTPTTAAEAISDFRERVEASGGVQ